MIRSSSLRSSVQFHGARLMLAMSHGRALANGRAFVFGATVAAIWVMVLGCPAFALTNVANVVCGWAPSVGAVGTAGAFIVFTGGLAYISIGKREGKEKAMWAILGAIALFGGVGLFAALTGGTCGQASA